MSSSDIHHLAAAYALDALDSRERADFEAHYPTCDVCRADVLDFRATLADLAAAEPVAPRPDMKAAVMQQIAHTRQLSPLLPDVVADLAERRRRRTMTTLLSAAAAIVLLVGAAAFVVGRSGSGTEGFAAEIADVLDAPDARLVTLSGSGDGQVRVAWSDSADRAVVLGDDLPDPGPGRVYELWLIDDAGARPMRLLDRADDGSVRRSVAVEGTPQAWGITIEPAGGSPAPTGEVLYSSEA